MDTADPYFELKKEFYLSYDACRNPTKPPVAVLRELDGGVLRIPDLELGSAEIPAVHRFLQSKQALEGIHTLAVCRVITDVPRKIRALRGMHHSGELVSSLLAERARLFMAIAEFIGRSRRLRSISFDAVHFTDPVLDALGVALSKNKSGLVSIRISHCGLEDAGFRRIVPSLARLPALQCLTFENCRLTDNGVPMIISILKANSSIMDADAWNSSLRHNSDDDDQDNMELGDRSNWSGVHNLSRIGRSVGLVALSLAGNRISDAGLELLGRALRRDRWLLGLNMWGNPVTDYGIERFSRAISSPSSVCSLGALVLPRADGMHVSRSAHDLVAQIVTPHAMLTSRRYSHIDVESASRLMSWSQWQQDIRIKPALKTTTQNDREASECVSSQDDAQYAASGGRSSGTAEAFEFLAPPTDTSMLEEDFVVSPNNRYHGDSERPPSRLSIRPRSASAVSLPESQPYPDGVDHDEYLQYNSGVQPPVRAASSQSPNRPRSQKRSSKASSEAARGSVGASRQYTQRSRASSSSLYNSTVASRASMVHNMADKGTRNVQSSEFVGSQSYGKDSVNVKAARSKSPSHKTSRRHGRGGEKQRESVSASGSRKSPSKSRKSELDEFSSAIHSVTSNLEKVSDQLREITSSLASTLSMSMMSMSPSFVSQQNSVLVRSQSPPSALKAASSSVVYRATPSPSLAEQRRGYAVAEEEDGTAPSMTENSNARSDNYNKGDRARLSKSYDQRFAADLNSSSQTSSDDDDGDDGELTDLIKDSIRRSLKSAVLN